MLHRHPFTESSLSEEVDVIDFTLQMKKIGEQKVMKFVKGDRASEG